MTIQRIFNPLTVLKSKSCFLFGPRQTGKSVLIQQCLSDHKVYNLLEQDTLLRLSRAPETIRQQLRPEDQIIVIDEIQKLPQLLDEVHLMIEQYGKRFLLTGSSARSLKRKGVNMLGGRARSRILHPFVSAELGERFKLKRALTTGLIPSIYFSDAPREDLKSYANDYLREEIAAEARVRNIGAFSRFLQVAALSQGKMINFSQIANDAQVPTSTVREYFQILQDTLIADELPAFTETRKRKAISTSKYYFFDVGLVRYLQGRKELAPKTPEFGEAFESFVYHEIKSYCSYHQIEELHYWRSKSQFEVDFILNRQIAIEVKAKSTITARDLKGLKALREEGLMTEYIVVCLETEERTVDDIKVKPWQRFVAELWAGEYILA